MSTTSIGAALRRQVIARAESVCEYGLIHEDNTFFGCHVDHVLREKHGGLTQADNLTLACTFCNLHKGSDIGSLSSAEILTRFFNPRTDEWAQHFALNEADFVIEPLTTVGEVTARIFQFNIGDRIVEREALSLAKWYPTEAARRRLEG